MNIKKQRRVESPPPRIPTYEGSYLVFVVLQLLDTMWAYDSEMVRNISDRYAQELFCGQGKEGLGI